MRNLRESDNVFLKGNWYPVDESSSDNLEVIGEIPQELNGLFLRNGPNPKAVSYTHLRAHETS